MTSEGLSEPHFSIIRLKIRTFIYTFHFILGDDKYFLKIKNNRVNFFFGNRI